MDTTVSIGFIGQGFIGKHMADDFEERGLLVVRYALEPKYTHNKKAIAHCDIVFIAVPTPTTPTGFDVGVLEAVLPLVGSGKTAVIKSTILPGTTVKLQAQFPDIVVLHSPEFLREKHARVDTISPQRNIIGLPVMDEVHKRAAESVLAVLPRSPYKLITGSAEAELIKYAGNNFLALKVVYMNMVYEVAQKIGADYEQVAEAMQADPRIGSSHMNVIDPSGHEGSVPGRGAGGHCFPKDLAALRGWYIDAIGETPLYKFLKVAEEANIDLLKGSQKDLDLLEGIYGK